jgi:Leucine-rich repeat (LRR) protein
MSRLSCDLIVASTPHILPGRTETIAHFLRRISHLNLQSHGLTTLSGVEVCSGLRALYAFENRISEIPPGLGAIEVLVLDDNLIGGISNLSQSPRLRKLHLNKNCISTIEGLSQCGALEELHIAHQRGLPAPLQINPTSINCISQSLRWVDVSGSGLTSLRDFAPCARLVRIDAANNALADVSEILALLHSNWPRMEQVSVRGPFLNCRVPGTRRPPAATPASLRIALHFSLCRWTSVTIQVCVPLA